MKKEKDTDTVHHKCQDIDEVISKEEMGRKYP